MFQGNPRPSNVNEIQYNFKFILTIVTFKCDKNMKTIQQIFRPYQQFPFIYLLCRYMVAKACLKTTEKIDQCGIKIEHMTKVTREHWLIMFYYNICYMFSNRWLRVIHYNNNNSSCKC